MVIIPSRLARLESLRLIMVTGKCGIFISVKIVQGCEIPTCVARCYLKSNFIASNSLIRQCKNNFFVCTIFNDFML